MSLPNNRIDCCVASFVKEILTAENIKKVVQNCDAM